MVFACPLLSVRLTSGRKNCQYHEPHVAGTVGITLKASRITELLNAQLYILLSRQRRVLEKQIPMSYFSEI